MKKRYKIELTQQQVEDILSALSIAQKTRRCVDSPNFSRALKTIENKFWRVIK